MQLYVHFLTSQLRIFFATHITLFFAYNKCCFTFPSTVPTVSTVFVTKSSLPNHRTLPIVRSANGFICLMDVPMRMQEARQSRQWGRSTKNAQGYATYSISSVLVECKELSIAKKASDNTAGGKIKFALLMNVMVHRQTSFTKVYDAHFVC